MRRPAVYLLVTATVLVLGANWPIMSRGVDLVPPLWLSAFRLTGATVLLSLVLAVRRRLRLPARTDQPIWLSVGLVNLAAVNALVFIALRYVPPGRSSILTYTAALWAVPMAVVFLHERLTALRIVGLALGTVGLVALLEPWTLDWGETQLLVGIGMLLLAAVGNASTSVHIRGHRWSGSPIELMPWQLGLATVPIVALALALEGSPEIRWTGETVAIVAYQIVLGSVFGFWGLVTIARSLPAITANLSVMAVPVVGLATSVIFVGETVTLAVAVGLVLVLAGVALGLLSDRLRPDAVVPPA